MSTDTLIDDSVYRLFAGQASQPAQQRAQARGLDAEFWQQVTDSGFAQLLVTEAADGAGLDWRSAFPVLRGLGYWQAPVPLAETMVAGQLASLAGIALPDGPVTLIEQGRGNALQVVEASPGRLSISGTAHGVPWARHCGAALLSLADGRLVLIGLPGPAGQLSPSASAAGDSVDGAASPTAEMDGVCVHPHLNHAGLPNDTLLLNKAPALAVAANPLPLAQPVWLLGALARSIMLVGALESALEQAVRYAGERVQFGKPIAQHQAIQQSLALMAGDVAAARMAALVAAADAPGAGTGDDRACAATWFSTAVAKVRAGEAATRGTGIAHQVHGAIGFTQEHSLHLATRRLWAWREEFGTDAQWATELGRAAIRARAAGFWSGVTDRHF